jgi:DNA-directed RNA polymerase subunit beta'
MRSALGFFESKPVNINEYEAIRIGLASPEKIRSWSHGEVTKPETINYRTFKPERDGLFCAKIFGPVNDWECLCGKYKRMKHRGVICDKCGVEVTQSKVRRERMGHIELACPVSHVWFFKGLPSRMGHLLDMTMREMERILYYEAYIVVDEGPTDLVLGELINEERFRDARTEFGDAFLAMMGAEAIKELLRRLDIPGLAVELREAMKSETSKQKRAKAAKRLKVVEAFLKSGNMPEWMVLDVIPVIPPELRPLVPLDGGRFATSDLNDLYRRVINRNNRLKKLIELKAPDVIIRNEKRMLQEACDSLFDNGRRGRVLRGANNRPLKSLSDTLKGKQGRFRQNLLGKRVDYSGRSVIVIGPDLELHQCGLPKKMALELFKPFIYQKLEERGLVATIKAAKELVESQTAEVFDVLDEVIQEHSVLLNRAPTLHRLGVQAFQPVVVEGKAIKVHPLVCTAFNADFDGDQMAVHVPLSPRAQIEAKVLMMSTENLLSPAHGRPITVPTQDIVLGGYYLTKTRPGSRGEGRLFGNADEVIMARQADEVETQTRIRIRYSGDLIEMSKASDDQDVVHAEVETVTNRLIDTTVGRVIFHDAMPEGMPFVNGLLKKRGLGQVINYCFINFGKDLTVKALDALKNLGFQYATFAGFTVGIDDMTVPAAKDELVGDARNQVIEIDQQYLDGAITNGERYNKVIAIWSEVTEMVADAMFQQMEEGDRVGTPNSIYSMADSGARGSIQQIRQLAGMRGLMAKPSGEIIETPITANFREGLSVAQYFISTHGARKGLADTALKTADSGYLTRRLVDVAQDVIVTKPDCGTIEGIWVTPIVESGEVIEPLRDRIVGRVALDEVKDPFSGNQLCAAGAEIDVELASLIQNSGLERVRIRSVLTCETEWGVCQKCYGRDLSTGRLVERGTAVGVIAAQSIGEPGTQLTMRTFHIGGAASRVGEATTLDATNPGKVVFLNLRTVTSAEGDLVVMNRNGAVALQDDDGNVRERYGVVYGARLKVTEGEVVPKGHILVEWDPYSFAILTEDLGTVKYQDLTPGVTCEEQVDEVTGLSQIVVKETIPEKMQPQIQVLDPNSPRKVLRAYPLPVHAHLNVADGASVQPGEVLARIPRETTKTQDITGGLPRVVELFEARRPKEPAVVAEIDGEVEFGEVVKGLRKVYVKNEESDEIREYSLPRGAHINVREGDPVRAGEQLVDGAVDPHDILDVLGERELQEYLVNEIQEVYRLQGVNINDKHIEVIARQMMRWVKVEEVGDTGFVVGAQVDRFRFHNENLKVIEEGGRPANGRPMLLGITKASLSTDSFISAASFQETTRVLTEAAINGAVDHLRGLKENVIMGRLIPAGTGFSEYRDVGLTEDVVARRRPADILAGMAEAAAEADAQDLSKILDNGAAE